MAKWNVDGDYYLVGDNLKVKVTMENENKQETVIMNLETLALCPKCNCFNQLEITSASIFVKEIECTGDLVPDVCIALECGCGNIFTETLNEKDIVK